MLTTAVIARNAISLNLRQLSAFAIHKHNVWTGNNFHKIDKPPQKLLTSTQRLLKRYSTEPETVLRLLDEPISGPPTFFRTLVIFFYLHFVFKSKIDRSFILEEFLAGSKRAISIVSTALAQGDYDNLKEFVTEDTLTNVKTKVENLSLHQRNLLQTNEGDVILIFPADVVIKQINEAEHQVDITTVCGYKKGYEHEDPANIFSSMTEDKSKMIFCNYTFRRLYKNNSGSDWIITHLNHVSFSALLQSQ